MQGHINTPTVQNARLVVGESNCGPGFACLLDTRACLTGVGSDKIQNRECPLQVIIRGLSKVISLLCDQSIGHWFVMINSCGRLVLIGAHNGEVLNDCKQTCPREHNKKHTELGPSKSSPSKRANPTVEQCAFD